MAPRWSQLTHWREAGQGIKSKGEISEYHWAKNNYRPTCNLFKLETIIKSVIVTATEFKFL
eukprot:5023314-Amphidinium_carterae.1